MKFNLVWIFINITFYLVSSEASQKFNACSNLYQGANFSNIPNITSAKKKEESKIVQRKDDNMVGIPPVLLGNIVSRLVKLENFQKEIEVKEAAREKNIFKKASNELGLLPKKNNTVEYLESISKKNVTSERNLDLFEQVKNLSLRLEELVISNKKLSDKLSASNANFLEFLHNFQSEKEKRVTLSKRIEELSAYRATDVAVTTKKIEEISAFVAAIRLQMDEQRSNCFIRENLESFSPKTMSNLSLDSQDDNFDSIPKNRQETRAQSPESTPNLSLNINLLPNF